LEKQVLFSVNDEPHSFFYVVRMVRWRYPVLYDEEQLLIDECDEVTFLGLRPFFAKDTDDCSVVKKAQVLCHSDSYF
jgi:CBS domain-containing protein